MKLSERVQAVKELEQVFTPWEFSRIFGTVSLFGSQICIQGSGDRDYVDIEEMQQAITWLVKELGGQVKWQKENKK